MAFDQTTRNRLNRFVADSRGLLAAEFTRQLQATYGMNPTTGEVVNINSLAGLTPHQQETAQLLRDTFEHYLAANVHSKGKSKEKENRLAALDRIVREQAFTVLNRLAALRMSEARGFLTESLANGYDSKGFQLFHRIAGTSLGETGEAYTHYLFSIFDEFALDLSVLFDRFAAQGRLFPSTPVLLELLALINNDEVAPLWAEDETIGWIYQYFNSQEERKKMRDASQAPRNSRELAVRNQFFTPRYVVEFLTDNTLGRIWYEMTKGQTKLVDECEYLVKRPNEIFLNQGEPTPEQDQTEGLSQEELLKQTVYIEHRALKDPRDIKMLDPACGSMHFGLYCFDLFERIYSEAWDIEAAQGSDVFIRENAQQSLTQSYNDKAEFLTHVPRLIIEHNIHGVDIDPRAAQVAGMSLWQRAHNSWQQAGVKPQLRPQITKSNIVCAEPMPGEKELLQEFASLLKPTVLGQLVEVIFEKMQLAGEAGILLKIEKEIEDAIAGAKAIWQQQNQALSQFPDLVKVAKQRGEVDFDVSDIDDEGFWHQAEQKILDALAQYASSTSADMTEQKRLFASDAAKGFGFIDLCKKRFDVVLMNPPFGQPSKKVQDYVKKRQLKGRDLAADFVSNGLCMLKEGARLGAITTRTIFYLKGYSDWRSKIGNLTNGPELYLDLGFGVLDAAVETSCYTMQRGRSQDIGLYFDQKGNHELIESGQRKLVDKCKLYVKNFEDFKEIPRTPLCYWASDGQLSSFKLNAPLNNSFNVLSGGNPRDDFRFVRHWLEVHSRDWDSNYVLYSKGGEFSLYFYDVHLALNWQHDGKQLKVHCSEYRSNLGWSPDWKALMMNYNYYFNPGITWPRRTSRLSFRFLPAGCVFGDKSPVIQAGEQSTTDLIPLIGELNTSSFDKLVSLMVGSSELAQSFEVGIISSIPKRIRDQKIVAAIVSKQWNIMCELDSINETSHYFIYPFLSSSISNSFAQSYQNLIYEQQVLIDNFIANQNELDLLFNLDDKDGFKVKAEDFEITSKKQYAKNLVSYAVGILFGRWNTKFVKENLTFTPFKNPGYGSPTLLTHSSKTTFKIIDSDLTTVLQSFFSEDNNWKVDLLDSLGCDSISNYIQRPTMFFSDHLEKYTKSKRHFPIYWQLSSKGLSFSVWLYSYEASSQLLYGVLNNEIEPELHCTVVELNTLKSKDTRNASEEKKIDNLTILKAEIEEFKEEIMHISTFWQPNLNDGVQITAAPLWRLFQHKPWQKKLKQTWEQLQEGEYDWAHLAFSTWPERVLKKCHADRSLAIAHDVENDLWHEVEVIKKNKKELAWEWQPKSLSDAELHAYIKEKIATDERLKLYRSNQANNLNGGKL